MINWTRPRPTAPTTRREQRRPPRRRRPELAASRSSHEIGHAMMDDVYEDAYPAAPNCNPHTIQGAPRPVARGPRAWPSGSRPTVYNDPFYRWPNGASLNLETPTWGTGGWGTGDIDRGPRRGRADRLSDATNEASGTATARAPTDQSGTRSAPRLEHVQRSSGRHRAADGFNVADTQPARLTRTRSTTRSVTRCNYAELTPADAVAPAQLPLQHDRPVLVGRGGAPAAPAPTTTSTSTTTATRPPIWAAAPTAARRSTSSRSTPTAGRSATTTRASAVVRSRQLPGRERPGHELDRLRHLPVAMGAQRRVVVRDVYLSAGVTETLRATATNGGQDAELFVLASDASSPRGSARAASASAAASATGPGGTETIVFTRPPAAGTASC